MQTIITTLHFAIYQGRREGDVFTSYVGRFAYDEGNERYRFLEGLVDEREPLYAHYFFFAEVDAISQLPRVNAILYSTVSAAEISVAC